MKEKLTNERGQVGIGTLIVFIALVLVAAIAAGVLINTAGFLQTQAEDTGTESTDQVSNNIEVLGASGEVDTSGNDKVNDVTLTVTRTSGSDDVDLDEVSIEWIGDNGFGNVISESAADDADASGEDGVFTVDRVKAATDDNVITADSDRYGLEFSTLDEGYTEGDTSGFNELDALLPGETATLTLTTQDGASRETTLNVPSTLTDKENVAL